MKSLYTARDITIDDIVNICNQLTKMYALNSLGIQEFEPEPITEGGIRFKSYSGIGYLEPYKSIRFIQNRIWPMIEEKWELGDTTVVIEKYYRIDFFLKAFDYAPKWTEEEKKIFKVVFLNNGFSSTKRGLRIKN